MVKPPSSLFSGAIIIVAEIFLLIFGDYGTGAVRVAFLSIVLFALALGIVLVVLGIKELRRRIRARDFALSKESAEEPR